MSNEITITLPKIDETIIDQIATETLATLETETLAVQALREKYAVLAKQNGEIKIGNRRNGNPNYSFNDSAYFERDGKKVKGLLAMDGFNDKKTGEWHGVFFGRRLFLTPDGWLEIERSGSWSSYQNETDSWSCGEVDYNDGNDDDSAYPGYVSPSGHIRTLTDAEVAAGYEIDLICADLSKALGTLAEKLPARMAKLQQRARLASQLLAALK